MVYPRHGQTATTHHSGSDSTTSNNTRSTKKKRKKQPVNTLKPYSSAKKVKQHLAQEEQRRQDVEVGSLSPSPLTPTPKAAASPEIFVFHTKKAYQRARAIFSLGYSTSLSADTRREDLDIPATLRWNDVMSVLSSKPILCHVLSMKGVAQKIVRPARNGLVSRSVVLHKPHAHNPRCEREVLENIAGQLMRAFGWEKDQFVLAAKVVGIEGSVEEDEEDETVGSDGEGEVDDEVEDEDEETDEAFGGDAEDEAATTEHGEWSEANDIRDAMDTDLN